MPEILSIGELLDLGNANNSAYIPYSGLEYNASGAISGISGSAIAGGIESSVVSSIVSSMVSGKADQSAVEDCCSAMSAEVSAKLDATASSLFQPSGNYQPSGDYYSATNPSGFITTAELSAYVVESSYSSFTSEVTNNITSISSTVSGLTGDYLEKSASSMFAPSGEYAYESSLSSYLPSSASSNFAPSADYALASSLSSYIPYSSVAGADSKITSINGSAIGGTGSEFTGVVTDETLTGNGLPDSALGVDNYNVLFDSSLYSSLDGDNVTIGVKSGIYQPSGDYYPASNPSGFISSVDLSNYATTGYVDSSVSGKLDSSASTGFYTTDNPSGFITGVDLSNYATTGYVDSSVSGKLDSSASSSFYTTDNPSGFITGVDLSNYATTTYVDSSVSGKQDTLTFAYDDDKISAINGSALAGGGVATGDYYEKSATEIAYGPSATATQSSLSIGLASSNYGSIAINASNYSNFDSSVASVMSVAVGMACNARSQSLSLGRKCSATDKSIAVGDTAVASGASLAFGYSVSASSLSIAAGLDVTANNTAVAFGKYNLRGNGHTSSGDSAAFVIGDGAYNARHDLMLVTKDGEITMYSGTADTVGTGIMSSIRALSANGGGVDAATVSAIASSYQVVSSLGVDGSYTTSINNKYISSTNAFNAEYALRVITGTGANDSAYISSLGGVDSATVSAIASSYVESSASGKLDSSASSSFYTTGNPSGFVDSAYVSAAISATLGDIESALSAL